MFFVLRVKTCYICKKYPLRKSMIPLYGTLFFSPFFDFPTTILNLC